MEKVANTGFWLSSQQKTAWTAQQTHGIGNAVVLVRLEGSLDSERLRRSLGEIVARQDILRTRFRRPAGMKIPFQVVLETCEPDWEIIKLEDDGDRQFSGLISSERTRKLNLEDGPVIHARLFLLGPERFLLSLTLPAMCSDTFTLRRIVQELGLVYADCREATPKASLRYAQIAQWQNDLIGGDDDDAVRAKKYWNRFNPESVPLLNLSGERGTAEEFRPEHVTMALGMPNQCHLVATNVNRDATDEHFLLAAWQSWLWRMTGQATFMTAVSLAGRQHDELMSALGPIERTVPILAKVEGDLLFSEVLDTVRDSVRGAEDWQEYFEGAGGCANTWPGFEYGEYGVDETYGGVKFSVVRAEVLSRPFMLKLLCLRRKDELTLEFHYDAGKLERQTVARWSGYFQTFLAAAVDKPDELVSRLPLLQESERRALLVDWNRTRTEFPQDQCVHQLFEAQALRTPGRVAVRCEGRELTYRELNQQANQLAHLLRRLGVGPDARVGLCLERSVEMLVGVIGILKAGGAYVPLSPDHPPARLGQQLAGATALLSERKLQARLPVFSGPVIVLDDSREESRENPAPVTEPDNLVYVIYTSGSTGIPKGVGVRHRNLVNYAHFMTRFLELERWPEGLQFATVSPLTADLGNTCIYPALISGGSVHVIGQEMAIDSRELGRYLEACGVDVLKIAPSHLRALLDAGGGKAVLPRKFLVTGGEMLSRELLERVRSVGAECEVVNHYGPTETTIGSLAMRIGERTFHTTGIPIGRPIANTRIYILDAHGEPVPPGVAGELYVAGAGVSAGYVDQPEQTGKSFLPDRCGEGAMYRTGDLARYQADGNVEFLGRVDEQVKIRGYRIEPGEIEAALGRHPAVREAAVVAREGGEVAGGDKRLVAYVVGRRERVVEPEQLRHYLQEQLPDYMIPAAILVLAKLPLNANGKLDRSALPTPEQAASDRPVYEAPRTPREQAIARIWSEVLRRDSIGRLDNFFYIGGHSLLATQVVSRMRDYFRVEIAVRAVFDHPTVGDIAEFIERIPRGSGSIGRSAGPVPRAQLHRA